MSVRMSCDDEAANAVGDDDDDDDDAVAEALMVAIRAVVLAMSLSPGGTTYASSTRGRLRPELLSGCLRLFFLSCIKFRVRFVTANGIPIASFAAQTW